MACPSSGTITIQDIVDEFGGSTPHSLSEYYRDGGEVPGNNTNVPTSGTISLSNFYDAVNEIIVTVSSGAENYSCSNVFGSNWTSSVPKRLVINSGIIIGGTGSSAALTIEASMAGSLTIENSGTIRGFGGAANGGTGGNAVNVLTNAPGSITFNNAAEGNIQAGGGDGGQGGASGAGGDGGAGGAGGDGGAGGNGSSSTNLGSAPNVTSEQAGLGSRCESPNPSPHWDKVCNYHYPGQGSECGPYQYVESNSPECEENTWNCGQCTVTTTTSGAAGGEGGAGGAGGEGGASSTGGAGGGGAGDEQSAGSGVAGSTNNGSAGAAGAEGSAGASSPGPSGAGNGGTGAGGATGGTGGASGASGEGGDGGAYGASGEDGAAGAAGATGSTGGTGSAGADGTNGNSTNGAEGAAGASGSAGTAGASGSAGSEGGLAGYYINNIGYLTLNNSGTVAGRS